MRKSTPIYSVVLIILILTLYFCPNKSNAVNSNLNFEVFLQEDGLPNNQIQSIYQDSKGWMWIGTSHGLSRFDGYSFRNFFSSPEDTLSIAGNLIRVIKEDSKGNLYIGTESGGLNFYDRNKERFTQPYKNHPEFKYRDVSVNAIEEDANDNVWIGTDFNLMRIDSSMELVSISPDMMESEQPFIGNFVRKLKFDKKGILWIGTNNGLFKYNPKTNEIRPFNLPLGKDYNKEIWEIFIDDDGSIWIGTYSSGAFIIDPATNKVEAIQLTPDMSRSETVRTISKGCMDDYWIGTRGGLFVYSKTEGIIDYYINKTREPNSLSNNSILSLHHDSNGEIWIGTRGGLNLLAKSKQAFRNFNAMPGDNSYLNSSTVYCFWIDEGEKIWIGTEDGGINIYDPATKKYDYLMVDENRRNSISRNCIKTFLKDNQNQLWVGTYLGGIDVIDLQTKNIKHFKHDPEQPGSLANNIVWDICMDKDGEIWIGTSLGVNKYIPKANKFEHYIQLLGSEDAYWIEPDSNGNIWIGGSDEIVVFNKNRNTINRFYEHSRGMFETSKNEIWITTSDKGIANYSASKGPLKYYTENDGLSNNRALCILEDDDANLWISTSNGLSKFNPKNESFQNFTSKNGLNNNQFCYGAAYKNKNGELLFGSISGFNMFDPKEVIPVNNQVPIVLTGLKVFNKTVSISDDPKSILTKSISETDHLILDYDQDLFTVEFAALNFVNSESNLYSYLLEGFTDEWTEPSKARSATYTNLNPGEYTLRIKKVTPGNKIIGNECKLRITIRPPFWKTNWFLLIIYMFILFLIFILVRFFINREKIKSQLVLERVNARKLHEVDMMKLRFFTNISHEIRTPLTLIIAPLEKMLGKKLSDEELQGNLQIMHRNAKNLDRLINQLLDFRKLQSGNLKLNLTDADIVSFVRNIVVSFNDYAQEKNINLTFNTLKKRLFISFDPDKIEKILNNLLSNAFKYTDPGGEIKVNLSVIFASDTNDFSNQDTEKQYVELIIKDTGEGIATKHLSKIFMRFFQTDEGNRNPGAGIGLSLVKELVDLHRGTIDVASKPGKGSKFTIRIPLETFQKAETINLANKKEEVKAEPETSELIDSSEMLSKIMLIIEDNTDVRQFIASHFNSTYKIYQAPNGKEGWEFALKVVPDIIISDIIMPKMDGYELCKKLKNDVRTSHIPVLLLTAMHSKEHELKGLNIGADDYITKPFDLSVIQAKVENLLSIRESLRNKYSSTVVLEPTNVVLASPDERFLRNAIEVIESNISDSDLDIESFATLVGVSRMQLYRKLHALTDMTVKEFIRHIRLKRATQLLVQKKLNISEIAYEVGFKDLSHFRKCFKQEYGMSASEYVAKSKKT